MLLQVMKHSSSHQLAGGCKSPSASFFLTLRIGIRSMNFSQYSDHFMEILEFHGRQSNRFALTKVRVNLPHKNDLRISTLNSKLIHSKMKTFASKYSHLKRGTRAFSYQHTLNTGEM